MASMQNRSQNRKRERSALDVSHTGINSVRQKLGRSLFRTHRAHVYSALCMYDRETRRPANAGLQI